MLLLPHVVKGWGVFNTSHDDNVIDAHPGSGVGGGYSAGLGGNLTTSEGRQHVPARTNSSGGGPISPGVIIGIVFGVVATLVGVYFVVCCGGWAIREAWKEGKEKRKARRAKLKDAES
ncbi:hypothetical protein NKR23_g8565 [Pleurostoma richardsiae]|uniref:Transmembrane protein n=1 Tax=Pleurostoma richardsiae TaxID=41990 RepID=A0AA38R8X9_9PEZI|nr:hypothetical protein NKR23_g8565 [Pleurostoma richardsiae]